MQIRWDIFCRVIDNFGDIGVTWRLARQLVSEFDGQVRLCVDDLQTFSQLCPEVHSHKAVQRVEGVEILHWSNLHWSAAWQSAEVADVVIEAFACQLPAAYINAMAQSSVPCLWLNLEYLSAEDWVEGCHGLPSLQSNGLQKFFFFPGFTQKTGGLVRETHLIEQRQNFQQQPESRQLFLRRIGVEVKPGSLLISLFSYEQPDLAGCLEALASAQQATFLIVPEGRIKADLQNWLGLNTMVTGELYIRGGLTIQLISFLNQADYDHLLWSCDFNLVRGEDSFVRGQWAGRPLLWQIYTQPENAHLEKLEAFLQMYSAGLSDTAKTALKSCWYDWNNHPDRQLQGRVNGQNCWQTLLTVLPELSEHAESWCQRQAAQTNLSLSLVQFYRNWLECAGKNTLYPTLSGS